MAEILAADVAAVANGEVAVEKRAAAALRTTPPPTSQKGGTKGALFASG